MSDPVRQAARTLVGARDEQVARVVALVDAMPVRGPADELIAPLRGRLRRLRPVRAPRFGRVLFAPLDAVIVPAASWRSGTATVPRNALSPIEAIVRRRLGAEVTAIDAAIAGPDLARVEALLWAAAASAIRASAELAPPSAWVDAGLADAVFRPLAGAIAAVLAAVAETPIGPGLTETDLQHAFANARPAGAAAYAMVGAVLLARLPHASAAILDAMASLAGDDPMLTRTCGDLAVDAVLGQIETAINAEIGSAPLSEAAREAERAALLLEGIGRNAGSRRRERLEAAREVLDAACQTRFADDLAGTLMGSLGSALLSGGPVSDRAPTLETLARDLRQFETAARRLGGSVLYDALLRDAAEQVRALPNAAPLSFARRVRLAEIFAGPEEALRLFDLR